MTTHFHLPLSLAICLFLGTLVVGCTSSTSNQPTSPSSSTPEALLNAAQSQKGEKRNALLLQACHLYITQNKTDRCESPLTQLSTDSLQPAQRVERSILLSTFFLHKKEPLKALNALNDPDVERISSQLTTEQQSALLEQKALANDALGQFMNSVKLRLFIHTLLPTEKQRSNAESLWQTLLKIDRAELTQQENTPINPELTGWIDLALIYKNAESDLNITLTHLNQWKQRWPQHPANTYFPAELQQLSQFSNQKPNQIALLIPLTGKLANYGAAISEGFFAAHFQTLAQGESGPTIRVYDSNSNITQTYQKAAQDGAQLIIGPLDKQQTTELLQQPLSVPLLALNQIDAVTTHSTAIQFGLSPDDDVKAIVTHALAQGQSRALILAPQGEGMERFVDLFKEEWRKQGGTITKEARYNSTIQSYASTISKALNVQLSEQRAKALTNIIGDEISYTPRPRQDIDMIFIVAKSTQARAILPMLSYHYAGNIPTYSTSNVFSGNPNPRLDHDLNNLRIPELPWIISPHPLKQTLSLAKNDPQPLPRMHALGIDAYQLYSRLELMKTFPSTKLYGATGILTINPQGVIERELPMAIFTEGKPVKLINTTP